MCSSYDTGIYNNKTDFVFIQFEEEMKLGRVPIVFTTINIGCHILPVMHSYKEMCMHLLISTITSITLSCTINSFKGPLKTGTIGQIQCLSAKQRFKIHYCSIIKKN